MTQQFTAYRGQHGTAATLQSYLPSLTFTSEKEVAVTYATRPNDQVKNPKAINPTLIKARITIQKPVINEPSDPFWEMAHLIELLGFDHALAFARKFSAYVEDTSVWVESGLSDTWLNFQAFIEKNPKRLAEFYMLSFPLLDDPSFVELVKAKGFDGAIHAGYGSGGVDVEYKVFDVKSVEIIEISTL